MIEHVNSEYPINIDTITSDLKDKRLNYLLKSIGELKLPGDGGVAQSSQGEQ